MWVTKMIENTNTFEKRKTCKYLHIVSIHIEWYNIRLTMKRDKKRKREKEKRNICKMIIYQ